MKYQIWMEGARIQGGSMNAALLGEVEADDFIGACHKFIEENPIHYNEYNKEYNSIWGCRLFDNEADARKFAG